MKMLFMHFRVLLSLLLLGFVISPGLAQTTAVTVTVTDTSGQAWANGTIAYTFKGNGSFFGSYQWNNANLPVNYNSPTVVALDTNGTATFSLPSSSAITPGGTSWLFNVCPNATTSCQQFIIATTGSTQNLSSSIIPTAISISLPAMPLAYSDAEIKTVPAQGGIYYNTKTAVGPRQWNSSSWSALGGGNTGTGINGATAPNSANVLGTNASGQLVNNTGAVAIVGGSIDNTVIGGTTPNAISGTTGTFNSTITGGGTVAHSLTTNVIGGVLNLTNQSPSGYSEFAVYDNNGTQQAAIGYANANASFNPRSVFFQSVGGSGNIKLIIGSSPQVTLTGTSLTATVPITAPSIVNSTSGTVTATPGTGVTSVTCSPATCTTERGTYIVVGGTATIGIVATLAWPTTTTAWVCSVSMNGGTAFLGLGHSVATATGMTVSAGVSVVGTTFSFDYICKP